MKLGCCAAGGVFCALCLPFIDWKNSDIDPVGVLVVLTAFGFGIALGIDIGLAWHSKIEKHERKVMKWSQSKITEDGQS
jgi:hypothetical protein